MLERKRRSVGESEKEVRRVRKRGNALKRRGGEGALVSGKMSIEE